MSRNTGKACVWVEGESVTRYVFILTAPYHSFHRVHTCQLPLSQGKFGVWTCPPGSLGAQETCFNVPKKARAIWSFKISSWEVLKACIPWIKIKDTGKTSWAPSYSAQKWTAVLFGGEECCQLSGGNRQCRKENLESYRPDKVSTEPLLWETRQSFTQEERWRSNYPELGNRDPAHIGTDPGGVLVIVYEKTRTCVCKSPMMHAGSVLKCYWLPFNVIDCID